MTLDLTRLTDVELLDRYRYPGANSEVFLAASAELERRLRRDGGWLSSGDAIYLARDPKLGGGIEVVPFRRISEPLCGQQSKRHDKERFGRAVELRTSFNRRGSRGGTRHDD